MTDSFQEEFRFYYSRLHVGLIAFFAGALIGAMLASSAHSTERPDTPACQVVSSE